MNNSISNTHSRFKKRASPLRLERKLYTYRKRETPLEVPLNTPNPSDSVFFFFNARTVHVDYCTSRQFCTYERAIHLTASARQPAGTTMAENFQAILDGLQLLRSKACTSFFYCAIWPCAGCQHMFAQLIETKLLIYNNYYHLLSFLSCTHANYIRMLTLRTPLFPLCNGPYFTCTAYAGTGFRRKGRKQ